MCYQDVGWLTFSNNRDEDSHGPEKDALFWRSHSGVCQTNNTVTEEDYHALGRMLAGFKAVKEMSIFTRKGDALNKTLAVTPIFTPGRGNIRPGVYTRPERTCEALPGMGMPKHVIMEVAEDHTFSPDDDRWLEDLSTVGVESKWMPKIVDESEHAMGAELLAQEGVNPNTAVGDVHFLDEGVMPNTASTLIEDQAHWKKVKPGAENVTPKQGGGEPKKRERTKVKKEQYPKNTFEWSDNVPMSVLNDKMKPSKRPAGLIRKESDIITAHLDRNSNMTPYIPHQFCEISRAFTGHWGDWGMNGASSEPLIGPNHKCLWMEGALRDIPTGGNSDAEKGFLEFMALFSNLFCEYKVDGRDECTNSSRDLFEDTENSSSRDLFDDYSQNDYDGGGAVLDDVTNTIQASTARSIPNISSKRNKSVFSQDDSDVEDAEMFGVKYSIRQRRINVLAVKRAIGTVLCNKAMDADMLNAELGLARHLGLCGTTELGEGDANLIIHNEELDLSVVDSRSQLDITAGEEALQMREKEEMGGDPTKEIHKGDVHAGSVTPEGRHTFASVLARLPVYLTGRTASDLTPINAFSVLLQMCNENNLELTQRRGPNNEVLPASMGDFTIMPSKKNPKRKHE